MTSRSHDGNNSDDAALVLRFSEGDLDAFEEIIVKYRARLFNICRRVVIDSGDAEDVMQEVFIKLFKNIRKIKNPNQLRSWLYSVALNQARTLLRWKKVRSYLTLGLISDPAYKNRADSPYASQTSPPGHGRGRSDSHPVIRND